MKIGFDAKRALHNKRGLGNFSRTLLKGLDNHLSGNEFHLYSPHIKDEEFLTWMNNHPHFQYHFPAGALSEKIPSLWRTYFICNEIKKDGMEIFHGLSHELPVGIEKIDVKKVVTIHDLIYLRYPEFFPWIDRKVYDFKFRRACRVADKIIAICEQTKNDLINFFNIEEERIEVHYQACHPQFYQKLNDEEKKEVLKKYNINNPFILFVGAFEERKNALGLLNAYASVHEKLDHDLVLIGRGKHYKDQMWRLVEKFSLKHKVHILENVPYSENPAFCQSADLMVYPSFFEGFGLPIVEGMFSETPVITSQGGVFPEAGGDAVEYINPKDPASIGDGILKVLNSPDLQQEMIHKGVMKAKEFHLSSTSQKLMNTYQDLLS